MAGAFVAQLFWLFGAGPRESCVIDDLFKRLVDCSRNNASVFLVGGRPETIYAVRDILTTLLPDLRIAGICDGQFNGAPSAAVMATIVRSRPDVIILDLDRRCSRAFSVMYGDHVPAGVVFRFAGAFDGFVRRELGSRSMSVGLAPDFGFGRAGRAIGSFARFASIVVDQKRRQGRETGARFER